MAKKPPAKKGTRKPPAQKSSATTKPEVTQVVMETFDGQEIELILAGDMDFPAAVDWEKTKSIVGKLVSWKRVNEGKKTENRVMTLDTANGPRGVWESVRLSFLFDNLDILAGTVCKIVYNGEIKLKAGRSVKNFDVMLQRDMVAKLKERSETEAKKETKKETKTKKK